MPLGKMAEYYLSFKRRTKIHLKGLFHLNFWVILPSPDFWEPFLEVHSLKSSSLQKNWIDVIVRVTTLDSKPLKYLEHYLHKSINFKFYQRFRGFNLTKLKSYKILLDVEQMAKYTEIVKVDTVVSAMHRDKRYGYPIDGTVTLRTDFSFSKNQRYQAFALPGVLLNVSLTIWKGRGSHINMYWIDDNYHEYTHFLEEEPYWCRNDYLLSFSIYCMNFSNVSPPNSDHYYVFSWNVFRITDDNYHALTARGSFLQTSSAPKHKRVAKNLVGGRGHMQIYKWSSTHVKE